jgi:hypothetical protein
MPPPVELATVTLTQTSPVCVVGDRSTNTTHAVAPAAITTTKMTTAINTPRRSPLLSGSVGGVLPVLAVGSPFIRWNRSIIDAATERSTPVYRVPGVPDTRSNSRSDPIADTSRNAPVSRARR